MLIHIVLSSWYKKTYFNTEQFHERRAIFFWCCISQFDPGGEEDADRLKQLFAITQHLMVLKAAQADIAEEQAAEEAKNTAKRGSPSSNGTSILSTQMW